MLTVNTVTDKAFCLLLVPLFG